MKLRTALPVVLISVMAASAQANLLINGDFETMPNWGINGDGSYTLLTGNQIPGWTIETNHGATVHRNPGAYPTITGQYSINMDGEGLGGSNCDMFQDFQSTNSQMTLDFDHLGWMNNGPSSLEVFITDMVTLDTMTAGLYSFSSGVVHESITFFGTGNMARIRVRETPQSGFNDNKFMVDNFDVQAVPEPASMAVLGLGALALFRRKRS